MPYEESSERMSNTPGLRRQLLARATDPKLIKPVLDLARKFPRKYGDGFYTLMAESQLDKPEIERIFGRLFDGPIRIIYVGLDRLRQDEEEHSRIHDLVADAAITRFLPCSECSGPEDEALLRAVKVALGTHKISEALDPSFGHDFSQIISDLIPALWHCYCRAVQRADMDGSEKFGDACRILTQVMPIGAAPIEGTYHVWVLVERLRER